MGSCLPQAPTLYSAWIWEAPPKHSSKFSQLPDAIRFFCYLLKSSNNTGKKTAEFSIGAHNTVQKGLEPAGCQCQQYSNSSHILTFKQPPRHALSGRLILKIFFFCLTQGKAQTPLSPSHTKQGDPWKITWAIMFIQGLAELQRAIST